MSARCHELAALALSCMLVVVPASARQLRVCADPASLPFSRADERGFENTIATAVAAELQSAPGLDGPPDRRGFARKTRGAPHCDIIVGVPASADRLMATRYGGASMFVYRSRWLKRLASFDDPRLRPLRIGVALIDDDVAATPPVHALARRGIVANVVAFPAGDRPVAERMVEALGQGRIDVAVLWGPPAGNFAKRAPTTVR